MRIPKIILTRPKVIVDVKCPKCKSLDINAIPVVDTVCKNCKTPINTEVQVNIYSSIAKKLNQLLGKNNMVWVVAERDRKHVFTADELIKPRSKIEDDYFHTLLAIQHNFREFKNWEVSEIEVVPDKEYKIHCRDCGFCNHCVTCTKCSKKYVPRVIKGEKRYTCPECKNKKYHQTYFPKSILKEGNSVCPYCGSQHLFYTSFNSSNTKCPKCDSLNISAPKEIEVYKLEIKRQPRFWLEDKDDN